MNRRSLKYGLQISSGRRIIVIMSYLKLLFGARKVRHQGAGVPAGQLFEYRAIAIVILALVVGFGIWILLKKAERYSYTSQKMGQISTASGSK